MLPTPGPALPPSPVLATLRRPALQVISDVKYTLQASWATRCGRGLEVLGLAHAQIPVREVGTQTEPKLPSGTQCRRGAQAEPKDAA